jgi:SulP family sulfate permease
MFFGFTAQFQSVIKQLTGDAKVLIIRMDKVPHIDQSGMYALEESITDLQKDKVVVVFTCIQPQPYDMLQKIGIIPLLVPEKLVFSTFKDCEVWLKKNINSSEEDRIKLIYDDVLKVKKAKIAYRL